MDTTSTGITYNVIRDYPFICRTWSARTHSIFSMVISLRANMSEVCDPRSICYSQKSVSTEQSTDRIALLKIKKVQQIYVLRENRSSVCRFKKYINPPISSLTATWEKSRVSEKIFHFLLRACILLFSPSSLSLVIPFGLSRIDVILASFRTSEQIGTGRRAIFHFPKSSLSTVRLNLCRRLASKNGAEKSTNGKFSPPET